MGQACSAEENRRQRRRKLGYSTGTLLHDRGVSVRAGARCRIMKRPLRHSALASSDCARGRDTGRERQDAADYANQDGADPCGILGSGDIEDVQFLEAVKGLIDGAVKLAGAEKGIGARIMTGLLRKTGMVDSFVDSMVEFVNRRLLTLTGALYPKDIAVAVAARLRRHVEAHDRTTEALGIRAGRDHHPNRQTDRNSGEGDRHHHEKVGHLKLDANDVDGGADDGDELQEDDVEAVRLWRAWKHNGGFWPEHMPDPDDPAFDDDEGQKEFESQLEDGVESFLRDLANHLLQTALPQDAQELRQAVGAENSASADGSAFGGGKEKDAGKAAVDTANRLAQLKSTVLEPMLVQVLQQQVIRRCCEPAKLWQLSLRLFRPSAQVGSLGHDLNQPEAFSLMAGALGRLGGGKDDVLRMELMQGLVKMTWGNAEEPSGAALRSSASLSSREAAREYVDTSTQPGLQTEGSQASLSEKSLSTRDERLGSGISSMDWSDVELGSEVGGKGMRDPSFGGKSTPCTPGGVAGASMNSPGANSTGGARDIFDIPYKEQLSRGLMGGKKDKLYEDLEARALEELEKAWEAEVTKRLPLVKHICPATWVSDRIKAARALARRPTNLMMALSVLDGAKDVLRGASDNSRKHASSKSRRNEIRAERGDLGESHGIKRDGEIGTGEGKSERDGDTRGLHESKESMAERGRTRALRTGIGGRRDTPGWRAWEARREWFFASDLSRVSAHFGRSLLGEESMRLANTVLKVFSAEYTSVETIVRHEMWTAMRKCSDIASADVVVRVKPMSTEPILYVSSQMRMLRALKKTGLDFSMSFGDGPQKKALSKRFKTYCWIFTDSLIDKLVAIRMKERARSRAVVTSTTVPSDMVGGSTGNNHGGEGGAGSIGDAKNGDGDTGVVVVTAIEGKSSQSPEVEKTIARELRREKAQLKFDVLREMTSFRSSNDLLKQIKRVWLPQVLAADEEERKRAEGEMAARGLSAGQEETLRVEQ